MSIEKLKRIWNFDFSDADPALLRRIALPFIGLLFFFGIYDVPYDSGNTLTTNLVWMVHARKNPFERVMEYEGFKLFAYGLLGFLVIFVSAFYVWSFFASVKRYGRKRFLPIFLAHLIATLLRLLIPLAFLVSFGLVAWSCGYRFGTGYGFVPHLFDKETAFITAHVPTITILPYPLAILAGMLVGALPFYFSHWLAHYSRLAWLTTHRCHHTAEILHPLGIGPFLFLPELTINVLNVGVSALASKLFYYQPLIFEAIFLNAMGIVADKLNHATIAYDFAYRNPLLRRLCGFFGSGPYHYVHHTSEEKKAINLGDRFFQIWDRIFGTYRTPPVGKPPVGLWKRPRIRLNPVLILWAGWRQIIYELRSNKSWKTRWWILFGSASYAPPITRDYLIVSEPAKRRARARAASVTPPRR